MKVYGSRLWGYNNYKSIIQVYVACRKTIRQSRHLNKITHNSLLQNINNNLINN